MPFYRIIDFFCLPPPHKAFSLHSFGSYSFIHPMFQWLQWSSSRHTLPAKSACMSVFSVPNNNQHTVTKISPLHFHFHDTTVLYFTSSYSSSHQMWAPIITIVLFYMINIC